MKTKSLLLLFLLFSFVSAWSYDAPDSLGLDSLTKIPLTGIYLDLPLSYQINPANKSGYIKEGGNSIQGYMIEEEFSRLENILGWKFYEKQKGYQLVDQVYFNLNHFKAYSLEINYKELRMVLLTLSSNKRTFHISASCKRKDEAALLEIHQILSTIKIDENYKSTWADQSGFTIKKSYNGTMKLYDIKEDTEEYLFKDTSGLTICINNISLPVYNAIPSETILLDKHQIASLYRQDCTLPETSAVFWEEKGHFPLLVLDTFVSSEGTDFQLVQMIMHSDRQRILITAKIYEDFKHKKKKLFNFINNIILE